MLQAGSILRRRYVIDEVIGQGTMAVVYRAHLIGIESERVAVKEMLPRLHHPDHLAAAAATFRNEARILTSLSHPGLVQVIDSFDQDGQHYLVTSYVEGRRLDHAIGSAPAVVDLILDWATQVCDVLEYLHHHDPPVIVRGLKPANLLVDAHGRVRLVDFGLSRFLVDGKNTSTSLAGRGTSGFAPVEQFLGGTDQRTDIYGLGATLYALLTGQKPPPAVALLADVRMLPPIREFNPQVPADVEAAITRMMFRRKGDRFASIREARAALTAGRTVLPAPTDAPPGPTDGALDGGRFP